MQAIKLNRGGFLLLALLGTALCHASNQEDIFQEDEPLFEQLSAGLKETYEDIINANRPPRACSHKGRRVNSFKGWFKKLVKSIGNRAKRASTKIVSEVRQAVAKGEGILHELNRQAAKPFPSEHSKEFFEALPVPRLKELLQAANASFSGMIEKHELVESLCRVTPGCEAEQGRSEELQILSQILHKLHAKSIRMELAHSEAMERMESKIDRLRAEWPVTPHSLMETQSLRRQVDQLTGRAQCTALPGGAWCAPTLICRLPSSVKKFDASSRRLVDTRASASGPCLHPEAWVTSQSQERPPSIDWLLWLIMVSGLCVILMAGCVLCQTLRFQSASAAPPAPSAPSAALHAQIPAAACVPGESIDGSDNTAVDAPAASQDEDDLSKSDQDQLPATSVELQSSLELQSGVRRLQDMGFAGPEAIQQALYGASGDVCAAALALSQACSPPAYAPKAEQEDVPKGDAPTPSSQQEDAPKSAQEDVPNQQEDGPTAEQEDVPKEDAPISSSQQEDAPKSAQEVLKCEEEDELNSTDLPECVWPDQTLEELRQMGFADRDANVAALNETSGDLTQALKHLIAAERCFRSRDSN